MTRNGLLVCCFLLSWSLPASAQKFVERKPYQQWTRSETTDIFFDSPWGQIKHFDERENPINVRLHSALPVRQALVRFRQIVLKYDDMSSAERARLDSQLKEELDCLDCEKYYILTLGPMPYDPKLLRLLMTLSLEQLHPYAFLTNDKNERRELAKYIPPRHGRKDGLVFGHAMFFFPRLDDQGKPLITADNKKFYFEIDRKIFKGKSDPIGRITFSVSSITKNGKILF